MILPGTPTLHRPSRPLFPPPPPPPSSSSASGRQWRQPLGSVSADLRAAAASFLGPPSAAGRPAAGAVEDEEEAGDEFSEDEFDPVEFDYENIRRPSPEGAEDKPGSGGGGHQQLHDYYDLAELNESFGEQVEDVVEAASECGRINIINNSSYSNNSSPGTTRDSETRQGATMVPKHEIVLHIWKQ
jgi:hypothetical protein